jgi:hypothetical protein
MSRVPIADVRLGAYLSLLVPSFVGHVLQIVSEDQPWAEWARERAYINAGWHLLLPEWVPWAIAMGLGLSVLGLARALWLGRGVRPAFLALSALYAAHYLTYPWRIRNHMTTMLAGLGIVALTWSLARARGALVPGRAQARTVDGAAVKGLGLVLAIQYFFAGLHKLNLGFLDVGPASVSAAIQGLTEFWIHGDLGSEPPLAARYVAAYGTVGIELGVPLLALLAPRLAPAAIVVLMLFHVPHIAVMNVADYPMIASASYPALLGLGDAHRVLRRLGPSRWTVTGGALGVATQLWFMPYWGGLMAFGVFVLGLWGWTIGAMAQSAWDRRRTERPLAAPLTVR